jgi:hypothetical protein
LSKVIVISKKTKAEGKAPMKGKEIIVTVHFHFETIVIASMGLAYLLLLSNLLG